MAAPLQMCHSNAGEQFPSAEGPLAPNVHRLAVTEGNIRQPGPASSADLAVKDTVSVGAEKPSEGAVAERRQCLNHNVVGEVFPL